METINNLASAASKAVWGEQKEPVSGVQGDTTRGEPYDAGNLATPAQEKKLENETVGGSSNLGVDNVVAPKTSESTTQPKSTHDLTTSGTENTSASGLGNTESRHENIGSTQNIGSHSENTTSRRENTLGESQGTEFGSNDNRPDTSTESREDRVSGGNKDTTAGQNDTRDPEQVSKDDPSKKQDLETETPGTTEGTELKGPGPRPVATVAKENGGDAGREGTPDNHSQSDNKGESKEEKEKKKKEMEAASEEVVHASGFAADGGDFDATKPGAGQEADRLLNEKHQHGGNTGMPETKKESHGLGSHGGSSSHGSHGHDEKDTGKDKPSLGERIKAKLHKH